MGCGDPLKEFNQKAIDLVTEDQDLSLEDAKILFDFVANSDEDVFSKFKKANNQVDSTYVINYISKLFAKNKLNIPQSNIWNLGSQETVRQAFNINVFLENSGSMNGYVEDPSTQFKNSIYSLLTRLKLYVNEDSLNLFFINQQDQLISKNASEDDVTNFQRDILNPTSFSNISNGNTSESDLNNLIKRCVSRSNDRNMSVFISDCIYSPGRRNPDARRYLAEQKQGIYLTLATELKNRDLSILILQISANFKGRYYTRLNEESKFENPVKRPFYIWFIGTSTQVTSIIQSKLLEQLDGNYENSILFQKIDRDTIPKYKIRHNPRIGDFDSESLARKVISNASVSNDNKNKGLFGFNILVDYSASYQNKKYFLDTTNYQISNTNYSIFINELKENSDPSTKGYTHQIQLKTTKLISEDLVIRILSKTPNWVIDSNSDDDLNILNDEVEQQKTFGLKYLIDGVTDAFYPKTQLNTLYSIKTTIKK